MQDEVNEIQPDVEPEAVSEEQAEVLEEGDISESSLPIVPLGPPKPRSSIFTLLLIISFLCVFTAIYLVAHELNKIYGVTFGGIISAPVKISEPAESDK